MMMRMRRVALWKCGTLFRAGESKRRCITTLYSAGDGYLGCLGHGDWADRSSLEPLVDLEKRPVHIGVVAKAVTIGAGWAHSAAVLPQRGSAVVWGRSLDPPMSALMLARWSQYSRWAPRFANALSMALDLGNHISLVPSRVAWPVATRVVSVYCGGGVTVAVDAKGKAFSLGCNDKGQCGVGEVSHAVAAFRAVVGIDAPVVSVALGFRHGLACDRKGRVWAWGKNDNGQVGSSELDGASQKETLERSTPTTLTVPRAKAVAAGLSHSACLTQEGHLFVWGKMRSEKFKVAKTSKVFGEQVGPAVLHYDALEPRQVIFPKNTPPLVAIAASNFHTAALDANGDVWAIGPEKLSRHMVLEPRRLVGTDPSSSGWTIRSGVENIALFDDTNVYKVVLHAGTCIAETLIDIPEHKTVRDVAIGWKHSLVLLDDLEKRPEEEEEETTARDDVDGEKKNPPPLSGRR